MVGDVRRPSRASARPSKIPRHTSLLGKPKLSQHAKKPTLPAVNPSNMSQSAKVASRKRPQPLKLVQSARPVKASAPPNMSQSHERRSLPALNASRPRRRLWPVPYPRPAAGSTSR
ncbi:hypothetical protein BD626DRAFT_510375, partial [Schizophyllum amplum]